MNERLAEQLDVILRPKCAQKKRRLGSGVFQAVVSKLEIGCGGLQPSELVSSAVQDRADSACSVARAWVLGIPPPLLIRCVAQNSKCRFWCRLRGNASFISLLNWTEVGLKHCCLDLNLVLFAH
jgi:hypothetical protein